MTLARLVPAVLLAAALSACSSGSSPGPSPPPSLAILPSPTPVPARSPVIRAVRPRHGSARVVVTGAVRATLTIPLGPNGAYQPPPGSFSLSFVGRQGNALIVGGTTPPTTVRTSSDLTLSLIVQAKHALAFPSARGECSITPTKVRPARFEARFTCRNLKHAGKVIAAKGTFVAFR